MSPLVAPESTTEHWSLDDVAEQLSYIRVQAGSPSHSVIARRVRQLRAGRGVPPEECEPGRITVYDCFRQGRRRMQPDLVSDIVLALGAPTEQAATWAQACAVAQRQADAAAVVTVRSSLPSSLGLFVGRSEQLDQVVSTIQRAPGAVVVLPGGKVVRENYRVYGARKIWKAARRAGHDLGRSPG